MRAALPGAGAPELDHPDVAAAVGRVPFSDALPAASSESIRAR
jgi:hypothetical protein